MTQETIIFQEKVDGKDIVLTSEGTFTVNGKKMDWYKNKETGKPWIPRKRSSLKGLIKQIIREEL